MLPDTQIAILTFYSFFILPPFESVHRNGPEILSDPVRWALFFFDDVAPACWYSQAGDPDRSMLADRPAAYLFSTSLPSETCMIVCRLSAV